MANLFVSYSRIDIDFARKVTEASKRQDLDIWIDWDRIPPSRDWWQEIEKGIEEADIFLFLLSPDSAKSEVCNREIEHAAKNGKRLIPVVVRGISADESPAKLRVLNWIFLRESDDFELGFSKLITAIHTDYEWVQVHRQLQVKALEWERNNYENSFLLQGKELKDAELQFVANSSKEPFPTDLHRDYLLKSRQATDRQRRITTFVTVTGGIILTVLTAIAIFQANRATDNAAVAESNALTAQAASTLAISSAATAEYNEKVAIEQAQISRAGELAAQSVSLRDKNFVISMLLGIEGFKKLDTVQTRAALMDNAQTNPQLQGLLNGHSAAVRTVTFSPDGKTLASGSNDDTIILWDVESRQPIGTLFSGFPSVVNTVTFSPDGKILASGNSDSTIILWDVVTQKPIGQPLRGHTDWVSSLVFSPDGKTLVSGSNDNTVILWDVKTRQPMDQPINGDAGAIFSIALSPDGKILATGNSNDTIILWDMATRQPIGQPLRGHTGTIERVTFSPDGKTLASSSFDNMVILWDVATQRLIGAPLSRHAGAVRDVAFSPDGKTLASGSNDNTIILWDVATQQPIGAPLNGHTSGVDCIAFSPDGKTLASGSFDNTIILWDVSTTHNPSVATGQPLGSQVSGNVGFISSIAFSPDGKTLASSSYDTTISLWDVQTGQPISAPLSGNKGTVLSVAFSPDGKILASGHGAASVILWDTATRQPIGQPLSGFNGWATSVAFSPDGRTLAMGNYDTTILLWDVATQKPIGEPMSEHTGVVYSVTFGPDGKILASGDSRNTIIFWNVETRQPIGQPLNPHTTVVSSVTFSPDGKILATASFDGTISLWDVQTRELIGAPMRRHTGPVSSVAFSPDGKTLASGSDDNTIILWDVDTRLPIGQPLTGHTSVVKSVAFSPDGKTLASGGCAKVGPDGICSEGQIILWDLDLQSWTEKTCQRVGRNFTLTEWAQYFPNEEYSKTCEQWPKHSSYYLSIAEKILSNIDEKQPLQKALESVAGELGTDSFIKDPVVDSFNLVETATIAELRSETDAGKLKEALGLLDQARVNHMPLDQLLNDINFLGKICWDGSLDGYAGQALEYCERAITLLPNEPEIHDNRGLARVLTGDYSGAIEDFQFFVENYEYMDGAVEQRQKWIEELQAGKNPFTPEVLEELKNQ